MKSFRNWAIGSILVFSTLVGLAMILGAQHPARGDQSVIVEQGRGTRFGPWAIKTIGTDTVAITMPAGGGTVNLTGINGVAPSVGAGTTDSGTLRVTLPTNGTGVVGLSTGSNTIGAVTAPGAAALALDHPAAASTATAYTQAAQVVAQRPTTVATAPTGGSLTAATATSVYAGAAGICQVAVQNRDATIHMFCGQTNAVSLTIGFDIGPAAVYTATQGYGGSVFCFPASGTPAYSTQPTACP